MDRIFYAHSKEGEPPEKWQHLEDHLNNVAELAKSFTEIFNAGEWGYLSGLWHDIGKYSSEFQERLNRMNDPDAHIENKGDRPDHSTAGAKQANQSLQAAGKLIAYTIAGHHAGLPDGKNNNISCLVKRLEKNVPDWSARPPSIVKDIPRLDVTSLPFQLHDTKQPAFRLSFFVRMLYSSLVDADFLDTEKFMDSEKSSWREGYPEISYLEAKLQEHLNDISRKSQPTTINRLRKGILDSCIAAADMDPGLFSLTVPTGGGKTLSSLAFGLKHAVKHGLKRIIYVIPYTSIIEQNADVFREALGYRTVVEHHSNYDPREEDGGDRWSRLASENWDAPVVVTTNVQFFESLFASRSSRCRKLHNIARSVVIIDEAQMLPVSLLKPCLETLKELSSVYGTTIVLCTATQPALSCSPEFEDGLEGVREIMPDPESLYESFKKVDITFLPELTNVDLSQKLLNHSKVLCICNTRRHAREVFELIKDVEGSFHLSALMCPAHRTRVLKTIKDTLKDNDKRCRVISTQLIEAGVDIDFPVVYRSLAGIDSIAQAAGRCNREGLLPQKGQVYVYTPESGAPSGYFRQTAETTTELMRQYSDPLAIETVRNYFLNLYWGKGKGLDEHKILQKVNMGARSGDYPFKEIAEIFKLIDEVMEPVIIPWNSEGEELVKELCHSKYPGSAARRAQRFTVQVTPRDYLKLLNGGAVERIHDRYNVLTNIDIYRDDLGLCPEDPSSRSIEGLIQ